MAYIGAEPVPGQNREVDDISSGFNGNATAFTLQVSSVNVSPESANNILINLGGVLQNPGTDYTINASTLTFTTAPASGLSFFGLILGAGINTATVADGAITTAKLASDAVGANQLANTSVTAGSYTTADITVDAQGRITAAASGTIANAEIADGAVTNAKVNASAAIAGTKISPDFGSQNIVTTGSISGAAGTFTGDVSIPDKIVHTGDTHTAMRFTGNDTITFDTGGTSRIQITDATTDVGNDLSIADTIVHTGDTNTKIRFPAGDVISFETGGGEKVRFNNGGALFGTTTQRAGFFNTTSQFSPHFQIEGAGDSDDAGRTNSIIYNSTTNAGPVLIFGKTMGSSVGSTTAVTNGAQLGMISFQGLIGSEFTMGASITAQVNGSVGDNDLPTDLQFGTTSDGGSSADTKMTLTAAGNLGLGVSSVSNARFRIKGANNNTTAFNDGLMVTSNNESVFKKYSWMGIETQGGINFSEITGGVGETMRINSNGVLIIHGTTESTDPNQPHYLQVGQGSNYFLVEHNESQDVARVRLKVDTTSPRSQINLNNPNGTVGSIITDGSSTSYNTSSDYRLKENAVAISDGIARLKTLKPYRFNFKADATTTVDGFFAHEVTAVPEAITGEKDAVDSEGKIDPQGIDQSKLVPLLTAALQEAVSKIETLETKVAALEAA